MKGVFIFLASITVGFAATEAFATTHGPFPCDGCTLATPIPDGGTPGTTLGRLNSLRDTIAGSHYGFSFGDAIKLCNATTCVTYTWRGFLDGGMVWDGDGQSPRIGPSNPGDGGGGGGGEGNPGPGPGPGGGFTLITLCGYVNNILDICLTYVASDPENPGMGGDVN